MGGSVSYGGESGDIGDMLCLSKTITGNWILCASTAVYAMAWHNDNDTAAQRGDGQEDG